MKNGTDRKPQTRRHHVVEGIGNRLRRLRAIAGITSCGLARRIGVDPSMPSHWEAERSQIRLADAILACDVLGCSLDTLARGPVT